TATANSAYVNATRSFWGDFDYSAYFDSATAQPIFHGAGDLANVGASIASTLWDPYNRWGFDNTTNWPTGGAGYGLPKEFIGTNYIGRYTQEETSHPNF